MKFKKIGNKSIRDKRSMWDIILGRNTEVWVWLPLVILWGYAFIYIVTESAYAVYNILPHALLFEVQLMSHCW